ncbi:hypothetical protein BDZ97DRAFT_1277793 [Flammula alnicola]|nr:hypothetical protein BDZ97DRAFT_1277793 [Flammula alnicola]
MNLDDHAPVIPLQKRELMEQEISTCDADIIAGTHTLTDLLGRELKEKLNDTSLIISSLPLDVSSEIFCLASESQDPLDFETPIPFLVGGVCKAWRLIAHSTPRLWSIISLHFKFSETKSETCSEMLQEWLNRSGNHPLHIYLDTPETPTPSWKPWPSVENFQLLLKASSRWQTLHSRTFPGLSSAIHEKYFPLLSSLRLDGDRDLDVWRFNNPPGLRNLYIRGPKHKDLNINWALLHHLTAAFNVEDAILALKYSHALRDCILEVNTSSGTIPIPNGRPSSLPCLNNLKIYTKANFLAPLLDAITAPALDCLTLSIPATSEEWIAHLSGFFERSACPLSELNISSVNDAESMTDVLHQLPSIATLAMFYAPQATLPNSFIKKLNPNIPLESGSKGIFLPNLTTFDYWGQISINLRSMSDMLNARSNPPNAAAQSEISTENPLFQRLDSIDISYKNMEWARTKHPNSMRDFHRDIIFLSFSGIDINFRYEQQNPFLDDNPFMDDLLSYQDEQPADAFELVRLGKPKRCILVFLSM